MNRDVRQTTELQHYACDGEKFWPPDWDDDDGLLAAVNGDPSVALVKLSDIIPVEAQGRWGHWHISVVFTPVPEEYEDEDEDEDEEDNE